ncbi:MAG: YitT family protein [Clostridia bacterium]|nr:YitT family protein [Clostridia bacterium]
MFYKKYMIYLKDYLYLIVGAFVLAFSTANILLPNQLSTGGFSGIATIVYYLLKFPVGTTIIVLNIPLCLIAFFKINKNLFFKSIAGTILLSFFIDRLETFGSITNDRFLACVYRRNYCWDWYCNYFKSGCFNWRNRFTFVCYKSI